jgi:tRNA A-37 threonylcarbamoyl transferase component Bud32
MAGPYQQHGELQVHQDHLEALHAAGLDSFDALMRAPGEAVLHKKGLAGWRQRVVLHVGGRNLYLKRYRKPPLREQLGLRLRGFGATAQVEWHWLRQLPELGLPGPQAVAYGCRCRAGLERQSLLLTGEVPGKSLEQWVPGELDRRLADRAFRARLGADVAKLVARLHASRLVHRDLYLSHVYIDEDADGSVRLALIDLQRVMRPKLRWRRWMIKDLAALAYSTPPAAASSADRLRFWMRYRGAERLAPGDKAIIRAVTRKARRIARHSARHGLG